MSQPLLYDGEKKRCYRCKTFKVVTEFYKHKKTSDRLCAGCKDCMNAMERENRKAKADKYAAIYRERDPVKLKARMAVRHRIESGTMKRQPCEVCGKPEAHAHHDDYSKPLDVRWLCPKHHAGVHRA